MTYKFLTVALLGISLLTNLTVEAIKKLFGDKIKSPNLVAALSAVILTICASGVYCILKSVSIDLKVIAQVCVLAYLSFLVSTVGYDKVVEMIKEIISRKD